jgi:hypothetical protein
MNHTHLTLATALAAALGSAGLALPAAPALAQGQNDRGAFFDDGWPDWTLGSRDRDSYLRGQYDRGYRMGRDDERRARAVSREYSEALEYLDLARSQIGDRDLRDAWVTLGRAETRLLTRATTASQGEQAARGGAIGAIRDARRALQDGATGHARNQIGRAEALVRRGQVVGMTASGGNIRGAGVPGDQDWRSGGDDNRSWGSGGGGMRGSDMSDRDGRWQR